MQKAAIVIILAITSLAAVIALVALVFILGSRATAEVHRPHPDEEE